MQHKQKLFMRLVKPLVQHWIKIGCRRKRATKHTSLAFLNANAIPNDNKDIITRLNLIKNLMDVQVLTVLFTHSLTNIFIPVILNYYAGSVKLPLKNLFVMR